MHPLLVKVTDWPVGWISILLNALLAGATLIYVILTRRLVMVDREAHVTVRLFHDPSHINLILLEVRNIGRAVARDITIKFEPDAQLSSKKRLNEVLGRVPLLLPNEALPPVFLGSATQAKELQSRFPDSTLSIELEWKDSSSRKPSRERRFTLNLLQYEGIVVAGGPEDVAKAIDRVGNALAMTSLFQAPENAGHPDKKAVVAPFTQPIPVEVLHDTVMWVKSGQKWVRIVPKRVVHITGRDHVIPILSPQGATRLHLDKVRDGFLYAYVSNDVNINPYGKVYLLVADRRFVGIVENTVEHVGQHSEEHQFQLRMWKVYGPRGVTSVVHRTCLP